MKMRNNAIIMLVLSVCSLISSYVMQYLFDMQPCPLCIMQRFCTIMLVFSCLLYFCFSKWSKQWSFLIPQLFFIILGIVSASRQMWLQLVAHDTSGICLPGFEELVHYFSWDVILKVMFWGSSECGAVQWTIFGLPTSVFSMGFFVLMLLLWGRQVFIRGRK